MKEYEIEENGRKTTIIFQGRKLEGLKLSHRTGSGPHGGKGRKNRSEEKRKLREFY